MAEPKFWAEEVYPSDRGLHFKFADMVEAQRFYLHLQYKGTRAIVDGVEVIITYTRNFDRNLGS